MTLFITLYVAIAIIAVWAILNWNTAGFIAVVAMSALHFGIGDAAFISELDRSANQSASPRLAQFLYAGSAGLIPVVIPLTNQMSTSALNAVNPDLLNWHGGFAEELNNLVTIFFLLALAIQLLSKRYRDGLDLSILFLLATLTPPLVAFAAYFGLWHAMRHTARLTLNLKSSQNFVFLPAGLFLISSSTLVELTKFIVLEIHCIIYCFYFNHHSQCIIKSYISVQR